LTRLSPIAWARFFTKENKGIRFVALNRGRGKDSPQYSLHQQANTEAHLLGTKHFEATGTVEAFGVWVPDDVERLGPGGSCCRGTMFDQFATDAPSPNVWFNEERIQLGIAIVARKDGREPSNRSCDLGYINASGPDLLKR
jgi:hypothetical protein